MTTKLIHLVVPYNFDLPSRLAKASPEQLEQSLKLADLLLETGTTFTHDIDNKQLRDKIKLLESTTVDSMRDEAIRIAKAELRAEVGGKDNVISELRKQLDDIKHQIEDAKTEKHKLNEKLQHKDEKIDELQEKLQNKQLSLQNASKRGTIGEMEFHELVNTKRPQWNLIDVHAIPDAMDRLLMYNGVEIRFDVKNHADNVRPDPDIKKFRSNMKLHTETLVGVMVALTATINKKDTFHYEVSPTGQLLLYFPKFYEENMDTAFGIMETIFTIAKLSKPHSVQNKEEIKHERLNILSIDKARNLLEMIKNESATFSKLKKNTLDSFNNHKRHLEHQHEFQEDLFRNSLARIENIIHCLSGQEEEISEEREKELMDVPIEATKTTKRKTKTEKK